MAYSNEQLNQIYERTNGYCHICRKKLSFRNYYQLGYKGAWEVDHSVAKKRGGTNHSNNLYAACIPCNRGKGVRSSKTMRSHNGYSRAPLSRKKKDAIRTRNTITGAIIGSGLGATSSPRGAVLGALVCGLIGYHTDPDNN